MVQARFVFTCPDRAWLGDLSRRYPATTFRILPSTEERAVTAGRAGVVSVHVAGADVGPAVRALEEVEPVTRRSIAHLDDGEALVVLAYSGRTGPVSPESVAIPYDVPIDVRNGQASLSIAGNQTQLTSVADRLAAAGVSVLLDDGMDDSPNGPYLTSRQREVLLEAVDRGYYDTPRECSLTELAAALGIAKSTCSETLHRAESVIVTRFIGST